MVLTTTMVFKPFLCFSLDAVSGENIVESLVSEGLVTVRQEGIRGSAELARLAELESTAKSAGKGKWASSGLQEHVRDIKWSAENPRQLVDKFKGKPIQAVVEHVRDGSTIRAFLLPDFYHITLMVSGIRVNYFSLFSFLFSLTRLAMTTTTSSIYRARDLSWTLTVSQTHLRPSHWLKRPSFSRKPDSCNEMFRSSWNRSTITILLAVLFIRLV